MAYVKDCRGLSEDTIKAFQLGWNPQNLSRGRDLWGLEEKLKTDGSKQAIWLPQGIVIPYFVDGILQRARIRRLNLQVPHPPKGAFLLHSFRVHFGGHDAGGTLPGPRGSRI